MVSFTLLRQQFGQIQIPTAVLEELRVEEELPGSTQLREAIGAGWLQIHTVENQVLVQLLRQELDRGEAEAIALAAYDNETDFWKKANILKDIKSRQPQPTAVGH